MSPSVTERIRRMVLSRQLARIRRGKAKRLKSKKALAHKPLLWGRGKWHSRTSLWKYKRRARRRRLMANASRRRNRTS